EVRLDREAASRFVHGSAVPLQASHGDGRHAVFGDAGLLGIGLLRDGLLVPRTVIEGPGAG
ncbi:MAG: tRNA pseudouridine(55) synthase TruB, partial [Candidatus Limnocylindria bacterium]